MTRNNFDGSPRPSPDRRQRPHPRALGLAGIALVAFTALHGVSPVQAGTHPRSAPSDVPLSGQNNGGGISVDVTQSASQAQHVREFGTSRVQKPVGVRHSQVVQAPDQGHHFVREGGRSRRADTHDTMHASTFSEPKIAGQKAEAVQARVQAREQQLRQTAWIQKTVNDVRAVDTAIQSISPGIDTGVESVLYALGGNDVDERATLQTALELAGQNLIHEGSEVARIVSTSKSNTLESLVVQLASGDFSHLHGTQFEKFGELARTLSKSDTFALQSFLLDARVLIEKAGDNAEMLTADLKDLYEKKGLPLNVAIASLALFSLGVAGVRNKRALAPIAVAAGTLLSACGGPAPAAGVPIVETAPAATSTPLVIEPTATVTNAPEITSANTVNTSLDREILATLFMSDEPDSKTNIYWGLQEGTKPDIPAVQLKYLASRLKTQGLIGDAARNIFTGAGVQADNIHIPRFQLNSVFDSSRLTDVTTDEGNIALDGDRINPQAPVAVVGVDEKTGNILISYVTFVGSKEEKIVNTWITPRQLADLASQSKAKIIEQDGVIIGMLVPGENGETLSVPVNQLSPDLVSGLMSPDAASTSALTPTPEPTATATITPALESTATPVPTEAPAATAEVIQPVNTLREAGNTIGVQIGFTFQSDDQGKDSKLYETIAAQNFGVIHSLSELKRKHIAKWGFEGIDQIVDRAYKAEQILITPSIFNREDDNTLIEGQPASIVEADMRTRLREILPHLRFPEAQRQARRDQVGPTYVMTTNELIDTDQGYARWDPANVYVQAFGEEAMYRVMKITLEEAEALGIDIWGGEMVFMQGMTGLLGGGDKLLGSLQLFHAAKQRIADDYGVDYDEVPVGIAAQDHASLYGFRGHEPVVSLEVKTQSLQQVAAEGPAVVIESELNDGTTEEALRYWETTIRAAQESGVKAVALWPGIRDCAVQPEAGWCNANADLFDAKGEPTEAYNTFLNLLITLKTQ